MLPLRTRLLYASSSLGGEALTQSRGLWLLFYYAPPADADLERILPIGLVGALVTAARLLDALNDTLVGYWSDRTRSRLGRRLPFILVGTPLWALFGFLVFVPPTGEGAFVTAAYLFIVLELFFVFATVSGGPYEALLPEIAPTSAERISIVGFRVYFGAAGGAAGLVASGLLVDAFGFQAMALAMAALALTARYTGMVGVWRRASRTVAPVELRFWPAMRATFSNVYFLLFLPSFVLFQVGLQMLVGVLPFYVSAVIQPAEEGRWVAIVTGVAIGTTIAVVPLFQRLARRTSKRQAYRTAMLAAALFFPLLAFAGFLPGIPREVQVLVLLALAGVPLAGVYLFPAALTADIADYDSLRTGFRREAVYYGAQNFVEKTATAASPLLLSGLLLLGRTAADPLGIRLVGPVAGAIVLVGYLVFRFYDLPDEVVPPRERERPA